MRSILEKLETDFIYATSAKYIGIIKTLGVTFASRLSEFTDKLKYIEKNRFITTAEKKYLYLHGGSLIEPNVANRAEGAIEVEGTAGVVVVAGTVFVSEGIEYVSARDETIGNDGTLILTVKARNAGSVANRSLGDDISLKVIAGGINRLAKVLSISNGTDDETEDEYRKRVKDFIAMPQAPFNENNIKYVLKKENGKLKYVWVKGGDYNLGKIKIFAVDYTYVFEQNDIDRATAEIMKIKPPQMRNTDIEIVEPSIVGVDVIINGVTPQDTKVYDAVKKNIEELFGEDNFEKGVSQKDIERAIYAVNTEGTRVEDFTIVGGVVASETDTVHKLNSVEVS